MNQPKEILKVSIEGYLNGNTERVSVLRGSASRVISDVFRGRQLDRINLISNLFTQEDCDDLINFLQVSKHCLPANNETI